MFSKDKSSLSRAVEIDPLTCFKCNLRFDTAERLPLLLKCCGYSLCNACFKKVIPDSKSGKQGKVSCDICKRDTKAELCQELPQNINLRRMLDEEKLMNMDRCPKHEKGVLEFYCLAEDCTNHAPACGFCIQEVHAGCPEAQIMSALEIHKAISKIDVFDAEAWQEGMKDKIEQNLEEMKERMFCFVDTFAKIFKERIAEIQKIEIGKFVENRQLFEMEMPANGGIKLVSKETDHILKLAENISRELDSEALWREFRDTESCNLLRASRSLFQDPSGKLADKKLFARLKRIDKYMQRNYFLCDFDVKQTQDRPIAEVLRDCFEVTKKPECLLLRSTSKALADKYSSHFEKILRNELTPIAVTISQIEVFLESKLAKAHPVPSKKWRVYVDPNCPLEFEGDPSTAREQLLYMVQHLLISFVLESA